MNFNTEQARAFYLGRKTQHRIPYISPDRRPGYRVGDIIQVNEPFWIIHDSDSDGYSSWDCGFTLDEFPTPVDYPATPAVLNPPEPAAPAECGIVPGDWWYSPPADWDGTDHDHTERGSWIFHPWQWYTRINADQMPDWAVRMNLIVQRVYFQQMSELTQPDMIQEGTEMDIADFCTSWLNQYGGFVTGQADPLMIVLEGKIVQVNHNA